MSEPTNKTETETVETLIRLRHTLNSLDSELQKTGWHHGVHWPLPKAYTYRGRNDFIVHPKVPLSDILGKQYEEDPDFVNSWHQYGRLVCVYYNPATGERQVTSESLAAQRANLLLNSNYLRVRAISEKAELRAQRLLKKRLSHGQWCSYVVNNSFIEASKRSHVRYCLRKGLPTLAFSVSVDREVIYLAALCLHGYGHYDYTFVGAMPPSDEVLTHLLMIRSDEKLFWRKAIQHPIEDPCSGV